MNGQFLSNDEMFLDLLALGRLLGIKEHRVMLLVKEGALPKAVIRDGQRVWALSSINRSDFINNPKEWTPRLDASFGPRCVYFIQVGDFIKIGWTGCVDQRLSQIQCSTPHDTILLHTIPGDDQLEEILHAQFHHLRHKGEWFRAKPELLDYIQSLKDGGEILPWFK